MVIKNRLPLSRFDGAQKIRSLNLTDQPTPERIFNAPLTIVVLAAALPLLFWIQLQLPDGGLSLAFRPASLWRGEGWTTLITSMFVHGGWGHAAMNAVVALGFGAPVARLMPGLRGVAGFLAFYLIAGVAGGVGYALAHPASEDALVGASGAVSGLVGAGLRLIGRRDGRLRPLGDRRFLVMAAMIMALNVATGVIGLLPGGGQGRIAWEAHAFGFVAGALLIGPWAAMFRSRRTSFDSPPDLGDPRS